MNAENIFVQKWFMSKIKQDNRNFNFFSRTGDIMKETEKAYLISFEVSSLDGEWDGVKHIWVPKKCTMTEAEYKAELEEAESRFLAGCEAYDNLLAFAKQHGVKGVRSGMRKSTIEQKIREAGIACA